MAAKLKIGLLTDNFPHSGQVGGIGSYTRSVAEELARQGHDAHVFTFAAVQRQGMRRINGVSVWECPTWGQRREMPLPNALEFTLRYKSEATLLNRYALMVAVRRACRNGPFDVIESPEFAALGELVNNRRYAKRFAVRLHGPANQYKAPGARSAWEGVDAAEKALTLAADVITSPTDATRINIARDWNCPLDKAIVVGNPVSPRNANGALSESVTPDEQTAVFFGRLEPRKGVDTLAGALGRVRERFPKFRAKFIGKDAPVWPGDAMGAATIREIADASGGQGAYEIIPPVSDGDLVRAARSAAMCVFPSRSEGFGIVVIEAMAWGAPMVISDITPFKELCVDGEHALFARTGDACDFAEKICRLLDDPSLRKRLVDNGREHVRNWYVEKIVGDLLKAWLN
jgi:glycosyltransferase involved in cell wall biosynthesis